MLLHQRVAHETDNTAMMGNEIGNITSIFNKSSVLELNAHSDLQKTGI
jgi:hypothetical protein